MKIMKIKNVIELNESLLDEDQNNLNLSNDDIKIAKKIFNNYKNKRTYFGRRNLRSDEKWYFVKEYDFMKWYIYGEATEDEINRDFPGHNIEIDSLDIDALLDILEGGNKDFGTVENCFVYLLVKDKLGIEESLNESLLNENDDNFSIDKRIIEKSKKYFDNYKNNKSLSGNVDLTGDEVWWFVKFKPSDPWSLVGGGSRELISEFYEYHIPVDSLDVDTLLDMLENGLNSFTKYAFCFAYLLAKDRLGINESLEECILNETKEDKEKFVDKFGKDLYDLFISSKCSN